MPPQRDPRAEFSDQFAGLVAASGMSTRDIERLTGVSKSTIGDWKNGKALPQDRSQLSKVAQALVRAAGGLHWLAADRTAADATAKGRKRRTRCPFRPVASPRRPACPWGRG